MNLMQLYVDERCSVERTCAPLRRLFLRLAQTDVLLRAFIAQGEPTRWDLMAHLQGRGFTDETIDGAMEFWTLYLIWRRVEVRRSGTPAQRIRPGGRGWRNV